ncbi:MAG: HD domain-containing protein [Leptospiraceae bacterium]|nr:HD domain-containing protein [Leptospiraceae bacterium]
MKLDIQKDLLKSLFVLANVVEAKDPYTAGHLWRVSQFSKLVGIELGLNQTELSTLMAGAFLHDLGKVGIPDFILNKKSKLDESEYEIIKTHPKIGIDIIQAHPLAPLVRDVIEQHHEMPSGNGYPNQMDWDKVTLFSKIVGICDALDAMTSIRPYRKGMSISKAISILKEEEGKQFDSGILRKFFGIPLEKIEHIVGHSDEGIPLLTCPSCDAPIQLTSHTTDGDVGVCRACTGNFLLHQDRKNKTGFSLEFKEIAKPETTVYKTNIDASVIDSMISLFPNKMELVA